MAITRLGNPAIANVREPNFRNIIINGDMSIAQRSTSVTGKTATGYYTSDRFQQFISSAGTWTLSQDTDVPTGQGFAKSMKYDCTTANGSLDAGSLLLFQSKFEGQNLQYLKKGTSDAVSTTLSFWVKSNKTGTYICQLRDIDNSRSISKSYTISSASTWEKKTITYDGDTTGAFDNDNGDSLRLLFFLGAGSNYTSGTLGTTWGAEVNANRAVGQVNLADSTSNEWYVTGVQLEAGSVASDFEFLPFDVNLRRCYRYYQFIGGTENASVAQGFSTNTTQSVFLINYMSSMRAAPTLAQSTVAVTDNVGYDLTVNSIAASNFASDKGRVFFNHNATATQFRPAHLKPTATASTAGITLSSEL